MSRWARAPASPHTSTTTSSTWCCHHQERPAAQTSGPSGSHPPARSAQYPAAPNRQRGQAVIAVWNSFTSVMQILLRHRQRSARRGPRAWIGPPGREAHRLVRLRCRHRGHCILRSADADITVQRCLSASAEAEHLVFADPGPAAGVRQARLAGLCAWDDRHASRPIVRAAAWARSVSPETGPGGTVTSLLITQRSRVQIPPPLPSECRSKA
jgi:hypothetical protein